MTVPLAPDSAWALAKSSLGGRGRFHVRLTEPEAPRMPSTCTRYVVPATALNCARALPTKKSMSFPATNVRRSMRVPV